MLPFHVLVVHPISIIPISTTTATTTYYFYIDALLKSKQVMIFVHARKETVS